MGNEVAIEVRNLTKKYEELIVLQDINFKIYKSEVICIAGGSGCGKSTLLRQIIGLEDPSSGEILINDEKFFPATIKTKDKIIKKFGVMFQLGGLIASMTIQENMELPLKKYTKLSEKQIEELISLKLSSVGLNGFQNYLPSEISGGMKKRASLARAMALDPEILFFDEPSSGLDPITSAALDNLIKEINSALNTTMVIVTHDLDSIFTIADRVILLDKSVKGILAIGTPQELKRSENKMVFNFFNRIFKEKKDGKN
jgi:phospholipid/cholesterol/gamma-HCH transport system ATP-binding protein